MYDLSSVGCKFKEATSSSEDSVHVQIESQLDQPEDEAVTKHTIAFEWRNPLVLHFPFTTARSRTRPWLEVSAKRVVRVRRCRKCRLWPSSEPTLSFDNDMSSTSTSTFVVGCHGSSLLESKRPRMRIIPLFNIDEKDVAAVSCVVYVVVRKCLVPSVVEWHWSDRLSCEELCKIGPKYMSAASLA